MEAQEAWFAAHVTPPSDRLGRGGARPRWGSIGPYARGPPNRLAVKASVYVHEDARGRGWAKRFCANSSASPPLTGFTPWWP